MTKLDLPERIVLKLPWGLIYMHNKVLVNETISSEVLMKQSWGNFISSVMTTMVVALDFLVLVNHLHFASWSWTHWETVLSSLEAYYWHACGFNSNIPLRLKLQQRGFMNRNRSTTNLSANLPDLLPQEVAAIEQILRISFKLYLGGDSKMEASVFPWIER